VIEDGVDRFPYDNKGHLRLIKETLGEFDEKGLPQPLLNVNKRDRWWIWRDCKIK
jgi:hypothetical protein